MKTAEFYEPLEFEWSEEYYEVCMAVAEFSEQTTADYPARETNG